MSNKVIFILLVTLVALGGLTYYTFGPGAKARAPAINPISLQPTPVSNTSAGAVGAFNAYHNKDLAENFYTIQFPQSWHLGPNQPGGYAFTFTGGSAKVETMDVSDNTTLELFVLSQDEPKLKSNLPGYNRVGYQKIIINGNDAYQLTYTNTQGGTSTETIRTYVTGADKAGVITFTSDASQNVTLGPLFKSIVGSFHWEK